VSDDELKALERALAASEGVADRLALARALERAGRADDALDVLLPARGDAGVRSEIGRWPAWGMAQWWRNGSSFIDAARLSMWTR
jgi:hypothetical protein